MDVWDVAAWSDDYDYNVKAHIYSSVNSAISRPIFKSRKFRMLQN